ncbi:hypothetical protein [Tumebacillus avium]|uniref:hypothetical protein n=1 Tax=Tumebacillus avium TaxID=1903704 RepID=UPI0012FDDB23|nr:hypothetical protein [Tumebacillus avium]
MLKNITKLFGYEGVTEGAVGQDGFESRCVAGYCDVGYDYHYEAWNRDHWEVTGVCCD